MAYLLGFLKPDSVVRTKIGGAIVSGLLEDNNLKIHSFQEIALTGELVDRHYHHVMSRAFYPWLRAYVTASEGYAMILETHESHIEALRDKLGNTLSHKAALGTVRNLHGIYAGINCLHVSDSAEAGREETELWKSAAGIEFGKFTTSIEEFSRRRELDLPDHTAELRALCAGISERGSATAIEHEMIENLLRAETIETDPAKIEHLSNAVVDSCFF